MTTTPKTEPGCTCCEAHRLRGTMWPVNEVTTSGRTPEAAKALAEHGKAAEKADKARERVEQASAAYDAAVQEAAASSNGDQGRRVWPFGRPATDSTKACAEELDAARRALAKVLDEELAARQRMLAAQDKATRDLLADL